MGRSYEACSSIKMSASLKAKIPLVISCCTTAPLFYHPLGNSYRGRSPHPPLLKNTKRMHYFDRSAGQNALNKSATEGIRLIIVSSLFKI